MTIDPEIKRQLDLKLAKGQISTEEYDLKMKVLSDSIINSEEESKSKSQSNSKETPEKPNDNSEFIQQFAKIKTRQMRIAVIRTVARILSILFGTINIYIISQLLSDPLKNSGIVVFQWEHRQYIIFYFFVALFIGYVMVWAWELPGSLIIISSMIVLLLLTNGLGLSKLEHFDRYHPELDENEVVLRVFIYLIVYFFFFITPFLFIICGFSSRALKRSHSELGRISEGN